MRRHGSRPRLCSDPTHPWPRSRRAQPVHDRFLRPVDVSRTGWRRSGHSSRTGRARRKPPVAHLYGSARRCRWTSGVPPNRTGWRDPRLSAFRGSTRPNGSWYFPSFTGCYVTVNECRTSPSRPLSGRGSWDVRAHRITTRARRTRSSGRNPNKKSQFSRNRPGRHRLHEAQLHERGFEASVS